MTKLVKGRRRGRPELPPEQRRSHTISVRLTDAEHAALVAEAATVGRANEIGRYLYEKTSNQIPRRIPAINREAWSRLGKVAGGLATIAKAASILNLPVLDRVLLEELRDELRGVRLALIGSNRPPSRGEGSALQ